MFAVLTKAARESNESIVVMGFEMIKHIYNERFNMVVITNNTFPDYVSCLVEFARNSAFPRTNLQAVELIKGSVPKILEVIDEVKKTQKQVETHDGPAVIIGSNENLAVPIPAAPHKAPVALKDDPVLRYWFPIHFGLYEIIMSCDLEVRSRALKYLFDILKAHSEEYTPEFWDVIARGVIFPIFDDLRLTKNEKRKFENKEDMMVWLNTTLIQALRQLIDLFSFSFNLLESMMFDGVLELITVCFGVQHENETLAKIGSSCLHQLVVNNVTKMTDTHWDKVCKTFVDLFDATIAFTLEDPDFCQEVMNRAEGVDTVRRPG
jgi:brefeldin A-inhibited guanine nucleotide-exchange protein